MAEFVSICDLPTTEDFSPAKALAGEIPITWGVPIPPHVDAERIQVNISSLRRMQGVAAFVTSVVRDYQGDVSESHSVAGINADGSAVAGKSQNIKKADQSRANLLDLMDFGGFNNRYGRPVMLHDINRPEAVQDIIALKDTGKTDDQAWASVLDAALRQSIQRGSYQHLVQRDRGVSRTMDCLSNGCLMSGTVLDAAQGRPSVYLAMLGLVHLFSCTAESSLLKKYHGDAYTRERRWSVFTGGLQPDRYIALKGLSKVPGLIKVQK